MDAATGRPGVLLDRDGTLIRDPGYLTRIEQIELLPGVPEALRHLRENGLVVVIITNQSAVARGLIREDELTEIHRELERRLASSGAFVDAIYYCPHHPTEGHGRYRKTCDCRKPSPGLATRAAADLKLELGHSYVVGDQQSDMELAARIGARAFLIAAANGTRRRLGTTMVVKDLSEAAERIVEDFRKNNQSRRGR